MAASFSSLSSELLTQIAESSWFTAARVEPQETKSLDTVDLSTFLDNAKNRSFVPYHLHNTISSAARLVADVAITALVSPIGLLYHTSQALYHSDNRIVSDRHWKCAKVELIRVTVLTLLVGIPVILGTISLSVLAANLIGGFYMMPLAPLIIETVFTLGNPFLNSRYFDANENTDANRIAQAVLRWDVGYVGESKDYSNLLSRMMKECGLSMLKQIRELQKVLPLEHRLPVDLDVNTGRILEYLEESREQISSDEWEQVKPLREKLIHYAEMYKRLRIHKEGTNAYFDFDANDVQNAYTDSGNLVVTDRAPPNLRIHSYTQTLFVKMFSSNWLYPSNCEPQEIEDKGSLKRSMAEFDAISNRVKIDDPLNSFVKKPLRWAVRALCGSAIIGVGGPIGTLAHGAQAVYYLAATFFMNQDANYINIQRAKAHAKAAWDDFSTFCVGWLYSFFDAEKDVRFIASREDRAGLSLSLLLKNEFGVSGPDGALLAYNTSEDTPKAPTLLQVHLNEILLNMYIGQSRKILYKRLDEYRQLKTDAEREEMDWAFKQFCSFGNGKYRDQGLVDIKDAVLVALNATEIDLNENRKYVSSGLTHFALEFNSFADFISENNSYGIWHAELKTLKEALTPDKHPTNDKYNDLKEKIRNPDVTPEAIFGFESDEVVTEESIHNKKKKLLLICHPDKNRAFIDEATEIKKFIDATETALLEELKMK